MAKPQWEVRVAGIRLSGDTFHSWDAAKERVWHELNRRAFELSRKGEILAAEQVRRDTATFQAEYGRAARQCPRPNMVVRTYGGAVELNRIPW